MNKKIISSIILAVISAVCTGVSGALGAQGRAEITNETIVDKTVIDNGEDKTTIINF